MDAIPGNLHVAVESIASPRSNSRPTVHQSSTARGAAPRQSAISGKLQAAAALESCQRQQGNRLDKARPLAARWTRSERPLYDPVSKRLRAPCADQAMDLIDAGSDRCLTPGARRANASEATPHIDPRRAPTPKIPDISGSISSDGACVSLSITAVATNGIDKPANAPHRAIRRAETVSTDRGCSPIIVMTAKAVPLIAPQRPQSGMPFAAITATCDAESISVLCRPNQNN